MHPTLKLLPKTHTLSKPTPPVDPPEFFGSSNPIISLHYRPEPLIFFLHLGVSRGVTVRLSCGPTTSLYAVAVRVNVNVH